MIHFHTSGLEEVCDDGIVIADIRCLTAEDLELRYGLG